ncbi:hypothetical protein [Bacillus phage vB_BanS-Thrax3]|nr:hypothetical protein [Bacillus phage vB_BanS-Thrax1]UUV46437.1 hypothetical protein [Bacillus phage vB_BanS-Thrax3]
MTKKVKNLTLTELKKQDKKLDAQTETFIPINGDMYRVLIDDYFRPTKQTDLLNDLISFFGEARNSNELMEVATPYTSLLLIKHFTNIDVPDDFEEAIALLRLLIDLKAFEAVLNAMPEDQVVDTYDKLRVVLNEMTNRMEIAQVEAELIESQLENEVVKKMYLDGETDTE